MKMMRCKRGASMTNLYTFFIILFVFIIIVLGIQKLGADLLTNDHANLDSKSIDYIASINGIDLSQYNKSGSELYSSEVNVDNNSGSAIKDFSLEYFFAREKSKSFEGRLGKKTLFKIPERTAITLLGGNKGDFGWIFNALNWFIWIALSIAIVYFIRGIITR